MSDVFQSLLHVRGCRLWAGVPHMIFSTNLWFTTLSLPKLWVRKSRLLDTLLAPFQDTALIAWTAQSGPDGTTLLLPNLLESLSMVLQCKQGHGHLQTCFLSARFQAQTQTTLSSKEGVLLVASCCHCSQMTSPAQAKIALILDHTWFMTSHFKQYWSFQLRNMVLIPEMSWIHVSRPLSCLKTQLRAQEWSPQLYSITYLIWSLYLSPFEFLGPLVRCQSPVSNSRFLGSHFLKKF